MADPVIGLFMEDIAHVRFIISLVERVASETNIRLQCDVRSATGGIPQMRGELRRFLRDHTNIESAFFDVLIIVQDADHRSEAETKRQIQRHIEQSRYHREVIIAAPELYIEAWYLADTVSIQTISGSQDLIRVPQGIADKDEYKRTLSRIFPGALLGGIEYADDIVENMDLYRASQNVNSLRHFMDELRSALTQLASNN